VPAELVARLEVLAAAVLFSTGGAAIKACSLTSWQVSGCRSAIAFLAVLAMLPRSRARWTGGSLAVGLAYAATMVLFVVANKLTTAANTIFLQYTSPLYLVLAGPLLLDEPVRPRDLFYLVVLGGSLGLFFIDAPVSSQSAPQPLLGNGLALLSGVFWAATALGLRWMARPGNGGAPVETAVACGNLVAFLACLPGLLPLHASGTDVAIVLYLGAFQIAAAYFFLTRGLRSVPVLEASLLLLLEPVLNPVWAWLVHGERPGPWSLTGGAVILVATAVKSWDDARTAIRRAAPDVQSHGCSA
jgi:drug/metabolite transporter (DMT)-like permease